MGLKAIFRTFILTSVIFAINSQAQETENAERKECCAVYEDSAKKTAWLICGENNVLKKTTTMYTMTSLIEGQSGKTCNQTVYDELEAELGAFDTNSRLSLNLASGTVLKLPSRALFGFHGIKSFYDNDLLNVIESDAFEGSSVQFVTFISSRAIRFDDNAFRQKVSTIKSVTLNVNGSNISSNVFKNFKNVSTIIFSYRTALTCPYLQYVLQLERFTIDKEDQPFSPCFLCGASESTRFCLNEAFNFENTKLSNLKESLSDVTIEEENCLVLKPGMRYSQSSACKNEKCVTECSSNKPVQVTPTPTLSTKVGRKKKISSTSSLMVTSEGPATPTISKETTVIAKQFTTIQVTSTPTLTSKFGEKNKIPFTSTATSPTERRQTTQNSIDSKSGDISTGKVSPTNRTKMAKQYLSKDTLTTNPSKNRSGSEPVETVVLVKEKSEKSSRKRGDTTKDCNKVKTSALMVLFVTLIARSVGLNSFFG